jgi:hypothetical protein
MHLLNKFSFIIIIDYFTYVREKYILQISYSMTTLSFSFSVNLLSAKNKILNVFKCNLNVCMYLHLNSHR